MDDELKLFLEAKVDSVSRLITDVKDSLEREIHTRFDGIDARLDAIDARLETAGWMASWRPNKPRAS